MLSKPVNKLGRKKYYKYQGEGNAKYASVRQNYHVDHFAEEMRRREDIQLLEVPLFSPCTWLAVSAGNIGFGAFLFDTPATGYAAAEMYVLDIFCKLRIYSESS